MDQTAITKVIRVINSTAIGTSSVNGSAIDMTGYDSVRFIYLIGAVTDGTPQIKAQEDTVAGMGSAQDLAGTLVTPGAASKLLILDVHRPLKQFVRCVVLRGGATGSVIDGVIAELYNGRGRPAAADSTVAAQEVWVSPAEGAA